MGETTRIVVVDGDVAALRATVRLLEQDGYDVHGASNGEQGLEMVGALQPRLVLLDVMLPGITGHEVLEGIRSDARLQDTSVVFLTAQKPRPDHEAGGPDAGADGYLVRPISNKNLMEHVRKHVRQGRLTDQLLQSQARFRNLVDGMADAILVVSAEGAVRYANPAAEALFQQSGAALYDAPFGIPISALEGSNAQVVDLQRGDGPPLVAEMRSTETSWEEAPAWVVSLRDITAQHATEEALRASEQRYRDISDHLPDIVWINRDNRIIYINPAGVRMLRAESESDILGRSPLEFIHPDFHDMVHARIDDARREPMVCPMVENCLVALDGTQVPVEVTAISYRSGEHMDIQVISHDLTARKRLEVERQELLAREQAARRQAVEASHYYRSLFESAPGCYLVLAPETYEIVAVSEAYLGATNTTRTQLTGQNFFDVFPQDPDRPDVGTETRLRESLNRVTRAQRADVMSVEYIPVPRSIAEGGGFDERFWSIIHSPVPGPDGSVAYIIHRAEDVTAYLNATPDEGDARRLLASRDELMEAEIVLRNRELNEAWQKLERSEAALRMASDLAQLGAWTVEFPDYKLTWSDEVYKIHGLEPGDPPEIDRAIEFYAPEHRDTIRAAFQACIDRDVPYDLELQIIRSDGKRVWVRTIGKAVRDADGRIVRVQGAFQNITNLRAVQAKQKLLKDSLARMLDQMGEGFLALDRDWRITYVNVAGEQIVGKNSDQLVGQTLWEAFPQAVDSAFETHYRRAMRDAEPANFEAFFAPLDAWIEVRAYPSVEGLGIYFRDVTQQRRLEEQFQQTQRLESIGQLTGGVAHDFNNLLTVILGNAELMAEQLGTDTRLGALATTISAAAQRGAWLTNALLAFARRQALDPVAVDVNQIVQGMHLMLGRTLGAEINIALRIRPDLPPAMVDPGQLESAILNLCVNARDAMSEGGRLTIETELRQLDEAGVDKHLGVVPGEYILIAVSDTGCGIPEDHLPRLFEPFFTTKEKGKGTGLGLPMVYGFVRQSGGQVNVYSEVGEGTTVRIYIPRATADARVEQITRETGELRGGSERVLLVEDDEMVRMYAADLLSGLGYQVTEAADAAQAMEILNQQADFDLLFTDVVMPGELNGPKLAEQARLLRPGLKVLFTSGYTADAIVHHGRLEAGVNLLSKPYRRADLAAKVRETIDQPDPANRD